MNQRIVKGTTAYRVSIFIGGSYADAVRVCRGFCDEVGLCVTVTPLTYAYRQGQCEGVEIGLINYARFPSTREEIRDKAGRLADLLLDQLGQGSYTIQDDTTSVFVSYRDEDQPNA